MGGIELGMEMVVWKWWYGNGGLEEVMIDMTAGLR
jgi:hypothetical protein